jgi:uracil-DNA glycosylase family 4
MDLFDDTPFGQLNERIAGCRQCPRLVEWREKTAREKRRSFADQEYWGRPVPNLGDPQAQGLIIGLAPAAHGANRTGRMFTGDRSGDFLFAALHRAGLASQARAVDRNDGLKLHKIMITAAVHCAPPANKPTREEEATCAPFLQETLALRPWRSILCLGGLAWAALKRAEPQGDWTAFGHGAQARLASGCAVVGCYHPSQQNTFTGRLTPEMMDQAISLFAAPFD